MSLLAGEPQPTGGSTARAVQPPLYPNAQGSQSRPHGSSSNESQGTTATNEVDRVFTPPGSDSGGSMGNGVGHTSSQESQLLQLSEIAAAQEKLQDTEAQATSRKRMADGTAKPARDSSSTSPARRVGHSRNTSTVSQASTTGSRMGDLSEELRTKLSYAMMKVNRGWQTNTIEEVESLASQAASPASSTSTLHGRHGSSTSPRISAAGGRRPGSDTYSPIGPQPPHGRASESYWQGPGNKQPGAMSPPASQVPSLAPPAAIQPRQPGQLNTRRNSNPKYAPTYLSHSQHASPHTPNQPSPLMTTPLQRTLRTPIVDPILFSPHQNVREQEALETLVFMSSPGNSANLKHNFPASQSSPRNGNAGHRTALPTSRLGPGAEGVNQARKTLPSGRPAAQYPPNKRMGYDKSPSNVSEMDVDETSIYGSPQVRGTPRRKANGHRASLSTPAGLGGPVRSRPMLKDDDIERMLDSAAANDSSDSEGEIQIPRDRRKGGVGAVGA